MAGEVEWVAVDWGTSNVRVWGLDAEGDVAFTRSSPQGMGKLVRENYPGILSGLVADRIGGPVEVLICGMAGARQGWLEAPYIDAPADLRGLSGFAVSPETGDGQLSARILPGVCVRDAGLEDVLRGEETQLLGLSELIPDFSGLAILPGTHSKWAEMSGTTLERFSTAMTGELFDVLRSHSVLKHSLMGDIDGPERDEGFGVGLETGLGSPEQLTSLLFKVRSGALLSGRNPAWCAGYLSGLLIGAEISGHQHWIAEEVVLCGATGLCELYAQGFAQVGVETQIIDATDATLAGLMAARRG